MKNSERRNIVELYKELKTFQYTHNDTSTSMYTFEETVNKILKYLENFCKVAFSSVGYNTRSSDTLLMIVLYKNTYILIEIIVCINNLIKVKDTLTLAEKQCVGMYKKVEEVNLSNVNLCNI